MIQIPKVSIINVILLIIVITLCIFLLLAENQKSELQSRLGELDKEVERGQEVKSKARKREMHYLEVIDSLKNIVNKEPHIDTVYVTIYKKINASTNNLSDVQLDSILTNYRFNNSTKERTR